MTLTDHLNVADRLLTVYAGTSWQTPEWTFREWFREAVAGGAGARDLGRFVDGGRYATHLQRFFALFPRDQIRIHLYEDYRRVGHGRAKLVKTVRLSGPGPG